MASRFDVLIDLLHSLPEIALATHSASIPGYPFATTVPFATDERHRPILLISKLAEHTRSLLADPRASLSVARALGEGEIARASLVGDLLPIEAPDLLVARYLRYHPSAARFLELGDFRFFRLEPLRIRIVGGFAQAGWIEGTQLVEATHLALEEEAAALAAVSAGLPPGFTVLGIDARGADCLRDGARFRIPFAAGPLRAEAAAATLVRAIDRI